MRRRLSKRAIAIVLGATTFALGAGVYFSAPYASVPAAYAAKMMCSGVFVSKRTPEAILAGELSPAAVPEMRFASTHVDYQNRMVDASWFRLFHRRAVFRDGFGCTLTTVDHTTAPTQHLGVVANADPDGAALPRRPSKTVQSSVDEAFAEPDPRMPRNTRAVVVLHQGRIVAERYARGISAETPLLGWSISKSVMNALVGVLVRDGKLTLDTTARFANWDRPDDARARITVSQLLQMTSGLNFSPAKRGPFDDTVFLLFGTDDSAAFVAAKPSIAEPGTVWTYSSAPTTLLSKVMRDAVGQDAYLSFPRRALFEPLGMKSAVLEVDAAGTFLGAAFMYATARDWARIGLLYLRDGVWDGKRILPNGWVRLSTTSSSAAPNGEYGAHFWLKLPRAYAGGDEDRLPPDAFHAIGHEGQFITVIPSRDVVIVRLGQTRIAGAWNHEAFVAAVLNALELPELRYAESQKTRVRALTHTNG